MSTSGLLSDRRWQDAGLSRDEAQRVLRQCVRFTNRRDELDDLFQTALTAIYKTFQSYAAQGVVIRNRQNFIHRVVTYTLTYTVRKSRGDALFHSVNCHRAAWLDAVQPCEFDDEQVIRNLVFRDEMDAVLAQLTPAERCLFVERFILQMRQQSLAEQYGVSQPNISERCRLLRIKVQALHAQLQSEVGSDDNTDAGTGEQFPAGG